MSAILELKYFNSFWLKKLDTIVEVENTTAEVSSAVVNSATINFTEPLADIGVGQVVFWTGLEAPFPYIYKIVDTDTIILNKPVSVASGTIVEFGQITNFDYVPNAYETSETDWFVEEARIRGGYNNTNVDLGVKAYLVEDNIQQRIRLFY